MARLPRRAGLSAALRDGYPRVALVVQKYGGTSVARPRRDQARRAPRRSRRPRPGTRSASSSRRWATRPTSWSSSPARSPTDPHPREHDMLLTAGERISIALALDGDQRPRPRGDLVHRLAGRDRDRHEPRQGAHRRDPRRGRVHEALDAGQDRDRRRLPGRLDRRGRDDARPRRLRHDGGRARGARSTRTSARSTPTSTASSRPTRASCPNARKLTSVSYEEMLELSASGARVLMLRSVEYARNHGVEAPRPLVVLRERGDVDREGGGRARTGDHLRHRPRHRRGEGDDPAACPTGRASRAASSGRSRTRGSTST